MTVVIDPSRGTDEDWARIVCELTRKDFIAGIGVAALALSGCGASDAPTSATRIVDTAKGKVRIPAQPQRIVCVDSVSASVLLELGVTPVGVPLRLETTVALDHVGDLAPLRKVADLNEGPNLEQVALARPDLILGVADATTPYDALRKIAPTVLLHPGKDEDWPLLTARFAEALGRSRQNVALRTRYEDRAAAIKARHADLLDRTRWAIAFGIGEGQLWLYYPDSQAGTALSRAGARFTSAVASKHGNYVQLSVERLGSIADTDAIAVYAENDGSMQAYQSSNLLDAPTWRALPAVKAGHVFPFARLFPQSYGGALDELAEFERALRRLG